MKIVMILSLICQITYAHTNIKTKNVEVTSTLNLGASGIKAKKGNDIWGWTDPSTNREYAIMGLDSKTSFVDVTDPYNPVHLGDLKTRTTSSTWRDIKVYKNHAFIVSEAFKHGMQVFDLTKLRLLNGSKVMKLDADVEYLRFGNAHNIAINEDTGFAYAVGSSTCDGGLHIINIQNPINPQFVTCVGRGIYEVPRRPKDGAAYTHDVQCVVYKGPDSRYLGREICVASNEDTVNVVDVTDKSKPYQISVSSYGGVAYTHQGWLTEDQRYFLLGDELDEQKHGVNTKTYIWDFSDLENIKHFATYTAPTKAIDHNMYVKGDYLYQANYTAGLRILSLKDIDQGILTEVGYMNTMPDKDEAIFEGVWSTYPYFESGVVITSGIDTILYIAKPQL